MKAIKIVRETRDGAIENETQVKFILDYEDYLKSDF